jgi:hypothetical protein
MDEDICPNGKTAAETRRETYERLDFLRAHAPNVNGLAFELREVWECSVNQELKKNPEMKSFFDDVEPKVSKFKAYSDLKHLYN